MQDKTYAVVNGRFQPLHHGHVEYIIAASKMASHLVIGITNSDHASFAISNANPHRSNPDSNPFSVFERMEIIRDTLRDMDILRDRFEIVPFPINAPERVCSYVPSSSVIFFTVYDGWGLEKIDRIKQQGFDTFILWARDEHSKLTSGSEIRRRIAHNEEWVHLVPNAVYRYIKAHALEERVKELFSINESKNNDVPEHK